MEEFGNQHTICDLDQVCFKPSLFVKLSLICTEFRIMSFVLQCFVVYPHFP